MSIGYTLSAEECNSETSGQSGACDLAICHRFIAVRRRPFRRVLAAVIADLAFDQDFVTADYELLA
jgi:hypothetical protein